MNLKSYTLLSLGMAASLLAPAARADVKSMWVGVNGVTCGT